MTRARGNLIMFLNPDTTVLGGAIETLAAYIEREPAVALVAPRLLYPDATWQSSARRFPDPISTIVRRTPLRWLYRESMCEARHLMKDADFSRIRDVDWALAAAIVMRRSTFSELGGFDERFRLYCEDIDLCWRAWVSGRRVVWTPHATIVHALGENTRKRFLTRATLWHYRSMAFFLIKNGLRFPIGSPSWWDRTSRQRRGGRSGRGAEVVK